MLKRACLTLFFIFFLVATLPSAAALTHLYEDYCTGADCILYLPMDEGTGSYANDTSQYENNATLDGTTWVSGYSLTALDLDGTNDNLTIPSAASLNFGNTTDFSVLIWFKSSNVAVAGEGLIGKQQAFGSFPGFQLVYEHFGTQKVRFVIHDGITVVSCRAGENLNDGAWHFVGVSVDRDVNVSCSVDGGAVTTFDISGVGNITSAYDLIIGERETNVKFNGTIDEVQMYNRALSASEILEQYQLRFLDITIKDEDTNATITGELATITTTNASNLVVLDTQTTTTGQALFYINVTGDLILSAHTNETYENQRRRTYYQADTPGRLETIIYLLEDGRGLSQPIQVFDSTTYQTIQGAAVQTNLSGNIIDYGVTDSNGRLNSYLDVYKLYTISANKPGEYLPSEGETLTPTSDTYDIYLDATGTPPPKISVTFNPAASFLNPNKTYIPMVTVNNYREADSMDFVMSGSPQYYEYYLSTGTERAGLVTMENFSFTNTGPWCSNASYICSIAANNASITFRYSQALLGAYGDSLRVVYNWSEGGKAKTDSKGYLWTDLKVTFADQFTDTQKLWVGFGIVFFGLFFVTKELVKQGYNPSIKSLGFIAWLLMLTSYKLNFFPESFAVVGTLLYIGGVFAGRVF